MYVMLPSQNRDVAIEAVVLAVLKVGRQRKLNKSSSVLTYCLTLH